MIDLKLEFSINDLEVIILSVPKSGSSSLLSSFNNLGIKTLKLHDNKSFHNQ
jgi:hypothetical protein